MQQKHILTLFLVCILALTGCNSGDTKEQIGLYNLSLVSNNTGFVPIMQKVNTELMFGHFGNLALMAIGIILFMGFMTSTADAGKSVAAACFIVFVLSIFFRGMDLIPDLTIFITLVASGISAAFLFIAK